MEKQENLHTRKLTIDENMYSMACRLHKESG